MKVILANPRGFCAGVHRAINIVERALDLFPAPIYVRHEVVHNQYVVDDLKNRGAVFVEELDEVPCDSIVIFSAHGVAQSVREEAKRRALKVFDATCPLVTKVHMEVTRASRRDQECILIGHQGHPEVIGTMGQYDSVKGGIYLVESVEDVAQLEVKDATSLCYSSQTTLSMDDTANVISALREKFPLIEGPRKNDICYATQNRQDAVKDLADKTDLVLVVGSTNSSNSNRLREKASSVGVNAYLIDNESDIQLDWFENISSVGVTAGASAPDILVQAVIKKLQNMGADIVLENPGVEENTVFEVPAELRIKQID
ncbi:4-hydroxy-3-methylbut-2-enyl diphosphate reductase [Psychromonas aquatilis]|uniref:4-hydroxy-3-methylbut-2-enyl diphosphate reductase n=1 Tax=Psychromonas aquatilis TaxID=2005072 RepID=A0ABU9GNZ4_9GAMM